ncbi:MAG: hypothetical protein K2X50_03120 [Gammaproteobacteria bacterium]|nr:hypothetical protein [Gammaproteobacteria bacterium]
MRNNITVIVNIVILISTIATHIFFFGQYYEKINNIERMASKNDDILGKLETKISVVVAVLQPDYPNININAFIDQDILNHNSPSKIAAGLQDLKKLDTVSGVQYLMKSHNFNEQHAKSVFLPPQDSIKSNQRNR